MKNHHQTALLPIAHSGPLTGGKLSKTPRAIFTILLMVAIALIFHGVLLDSRRSSFSVNSVLDLPRFSFDPALCPEVPASLSAVLSSGSLWSANRYRFTENLMETLKANRTLTNSTRIEEGVFFAGRTESIGNAGIDFVQDPDFLYLTGCSISSAVMLMNLATEESIVFLPKQTDREIAFEGKYASFDVLSREFGVDSVQFLDKLPEYVTKWNLRRWHGTQSGQTRFGFVVEDRLARKAMLNSRREKSSQEVELIRLASQMAALAHKELMRTTSIQSSEYSLLALFRHITFTCGCRLQAYSPIVGVNGHAAVLHYQAVNETSGIVSIGENGLVLVDASGAYRGYASDITRTFPVQEWSDDMLAIYEIVLQSNLAGINAVRPGVEWANVVKVADEALLKGLISANLVKGKLEKLRSSNIARVFMPHGLGHTVGVEVHDVTPPSWKLQVNDVLTIEPGIYFNPPLFEKARNDSAIKNFFNWDEIDRRFLTDGHGFGGVRIEDVVLVTHEGSEVLSADAPKFVKDIDATRGFDKAWWLW